MKKIVECAVSNVIAIKDFVPTHGNIYVLKQGNSIGLLGTTWVGGKKYYQFHDIFNHNNGWSGAVKDSIVEVFKVFTFRGDDIYEFENKKEFMDWLKEQ